VARRQLTAFQFLFAMAARGLQMMIILVAYLGLLLAVRPGEGGSMVSAVTNASLVEAKLTGEDETIKWVCCLEWPTWDHYAPPAGFDYLTFAEDEAAVKAKMSKKKTSQRHKCKVWAISQYAGQPFEIGLDEVKEDCTSIIFPSEAFKRNVIKGIQEEMLAKWDDVTKARSTQIKDAYQYALKNFQANIKIKDPHAADVASDSVKKVVGEIEKQNQAALDKLKQISAANKKKYTDLKDRLEKTRTAAVETTRATCQGSAEPKYEAGAELHCCCLVVLDGAAFPLSIPMDEWYAQASSASEPSANAVCKHGGSKRVQFDYYLGRGSYRGKFSALNLKQQSSYCDNFDKNCPVCADALGACNSPTHCSKS